MNNKLYAKLTIAFLFLSAIVFAQAPQAFSYQAIAANANGTPVVNGTVAVRISVLDNSATGTVLYTETHSKQTNAQGLFNLNIGQGSPTTGTFSGINWGQNAKYVKVELDPAGGTNYVNVGTNQLMSVPYALFADKMNESNLSGGAGRSITSKDGRLVVVYTDSEAKGFYQLNTGSGSWSSTSLSGTVLGAVATDSSVVVYTDSEAKGFYQLASTGSASWSSTSLSGTVLGAVASGSSAVVYTTSEAKGFYQLTSGSGSWSSASLSGNVLGAVSSGKSVVVYTTSEAKGFYQLTSGSGSWSSTSLSGNVLGAVASGATVVVYTTSEAKGFYQLTSGSGSWSSASLSGTIKGAIGN